MSLNIVDITTSAMRAVNRSLGSMCGVHINEMPTVKRVEVTKLVIMAAQGAYTSIMTLHEQDPSSPMVGGIALYIASANVPNLFGSLGLDSMSSSAEIKDACGEFCNVIAGAFKTEIVAAGFHDVALSLPLDFDTSVYEPMDIKTECKYEMSFAFGGFNLLYIDTFMKGAR